jgi:hypothetical protein
MKTKLITRVGLALTIALGLGETAFNIPMQAPNGYFVGQNSQIIWGMSGRMK